MNCKPGDLAIIIKARAPASIIGRIVKVIRPATDGEVFKSIDGISISNDADGFGLCWVIEADGVLSWGGHAMKSRPFPDAYMRPVSGLPVTDDIPDEVTA